MKPHAIVAEGPDDLAALRGLLQAVGGKVTGATQGADRNPLSVSLGGDSVQIWSALGKDRELAERTISAGQGTATFRPEVVVVCFDPDTRDEPSEFSFFPKAFESVRGERATSLAVEGGTMSFRIADRVVTVVPAPWRHDEPASFARLPDDQNLERLLLTGVLRTEPGRALGAWAEDAVVGLLPLIKGHGWKRAFRIWNAAVAPKSEAFVAALLQDAALRGECLKALQESRAWKAILALH